MIWTLAQDTGGSGLFTNMLLLTILFIFASAIVGAVVARRQRDRCLKLIDDYHITMAMADGRVIWGDLRVFAQGIEVQYDAPYQTSLGLIKSGYLLYQPELDSVLSFCRYVGDLTDAEKADRKRQVEKRFRPGPLARGKRSIHNIFNTIRDAFNQAMSAFIGQMAKAGGKGSVAASQKGQFEKIGKSILGASGNAYEPMLERHIGNSIVIELASPADPDTKNIELAGYLAEYSGKYLAVFNVEQPVEETIILPANDTLERDDLKIEVSDNAITITNTDEVPLVVDAVVSDTEETRDLGVTLLNASSARLARIPGSLSVRLLRMKKIDVVCPRSQAVIRYASLDELPPDGRKNLPPAHEDQAVAFP